RDVLIEIQYCGVCHSDIHQVRDEWGGSIYPMVPGHEIVGRVEQLGEGVQGFSKGQRVGIPWLSHTCGHCPYCCSGRENLCDFPAFTGYTRDGGFATHAVADAHYVFALDERADAASLAPLMCAGLIGWRSLKMAGPARTIGLYGFGAAAHVIAQVCRWQGRTVYAFTRPGDDEAQRFARSLGAVWAGGSDQAAPESLDAAIIFASAGELVPAALAATAKGGVVVCAGIHMSDIPSFAYRLLWGERQLVSVANLTRRDAADFLAVARQAALRTTTVQYPLARVNEALDDLRGGRLQGAAVLRP
ncbi:MAG: zinc-dependent alcohol dehydrogenase family protein, partial [Gammaproteobacteria bacterium]